MKNNYILPLLLSLFIFTSCSNGDEYPEYDPPTDHTVSKDGVMHKSGMSDPERNCAICHGADLRGGNVQVSCYECHGAEWN